MWGVRTPISQALKAVKRAFVPSKRDLEAMCQSASTLDPRTAEAMTKDFESMLAMIEGLASKSRENVLTEDGTTSGAGGARHSRMAQGGFTFTRPMSGHAELLKFLGERSRKASEICDFVQSFEARGAGAVGPREAAAAAAKPAPTAAAAAAATSGVDSESAAAAGAAERSPAATC